MKKFSLLALAAIPFFSGCAKGPSGGPTVRSLNRLEANLSVVGTLNPNYYYAVAFDDEVNDGDGPVGIDANAGTLNGVVGGSFRLAIVFHANQFEVYRRSDPDDETTEQRITSPSPFVQNPVASTNNINFVLDLDARLSGDTFFFPNRDSQGVGLSTDRFDINFATTNVILRGGTTNEVVKPVDGLGPATIGVPIEFQIGSTRRINQPDAVNGVNGERDIRLDVNQSFTTPGTSAFVDFSQIDVNNLQINVTRGTN